MSKFFTTIGSEGGKAVVCAPSQKQAAAIVDGVPDMKRDERKTMRAATAEEVKELPHLDSPHEEKKPTRAAAPSKKKSKNAAEA